MLVLMGVANKRSGYVPYLIKLTRVPIHIKGNQSRVGTN